METSNFNCDRIKWKLWLEMGKQLVAHSQGVLDELKML